MTSHIETAPEEEIMQAPGAEVAVVSANQASKTAARARSRKSASAFRTISEVAEELDVQQHVLRFWETKFSQVKPLKRGGGRRYYRPEDIALLRRIRHLLYTQGFTIKGVQKLLREHGKQKVIEGEAQAGEIKAPDSRAANKAQSVENSGASGQKTIAQSLLYDLKKLREAISRS